MRAVFSCQSPGAPERVRTKVSQFTPSIQEASSGAVPPAAVPVQVILAPGVGGKVPAPGLASGAVGGTVEAALSWLRPGVLTATPPAANPNISSKLAK